MSLLLPPGVQIEHDVHDVQRRIREGDPQVGWLGDPSMDAHYFDGQVAVYGFDRAGERYLAALINTDRPGWRHELLAKLRDGDWRNEGDPLAAVKAQNAAIEKKKDDERAERIGAVNDHLCWAAFRDAGQHAGGLRKPFNLLAD